MRKINAWLWVMIIGIAFSQLLVYVAEKQASNP